MVRFYEGSNSWPVVGVIGGKRSCEWVSAAVRRGPPACEHFVNEITNLVGNLILSSVNNSQILRTPHLTFCEQVYLWIILYKWFFYNFVKNIVATTTTWCDVDKCHQRWRLPYKLRTLCTLPRSCKVQGCTTCTILAAWLWENGERIRKWRGNGEKMRKWRENKEM